MKFLFCASITIIILIGILVQNGAGCIRALPPGGGGPRSWRIGYKSDQTQSSNYQLRVQQQYGQFMKLLGNLASNMKDFAKFFYKQAKSVHSSKRERNDYQ